MENNIVESGFDIQEFEDFSHRNGMRYWIAHEFMRALGYTDWNAFRKVINRAISACITLEVPIEDSFIQIPYVDKDGTEVKSYKLTRFACFLVTNFADGNKPRVAQAKIALAGIADQIINNSDVPRIQERAELSSAEKMLGAVAKGAGVESSRFGIFKDAGIRGMYNMSLAELRRYKGLKTTGKTPNSIYDHMGITELAGNAFRVTQTAESIKNKGIRGESNVINVSRDIGREVRNMMIKNSGKAPEDLPLEEDIRKVRTKLRKTNRVMLKHDKTKI